MQMYVTLSVEARSGSTLLPPAPPNYWQLSDNVCRRRSSCIQCHQQEEQLRKHFLKVAEILCGVLRSVVPSWTLWVHDALTRKPSVHLVLLAFPTRVGNTNISFLLSSNASQTPDLFQYCTARTLNPELLTLKATSNPNEQSTS